MDNSGSVRELRPLYARAMSRVCAVLDTLGFDTPVVGHTTVNWKGGESRKQWFAAERPIAPGRLNDFLVTIYKQPGQPTTEGDLRLYGLSSTKYSYKENFDGEALAWMAEKLEALPAENKTLIFVSDGDFPCDDSTLATNPASYLMDHRNAVIEEIQNASDIALVQVVATTAEIKDANTDMPRFGGTTKQSSEFVRSITAAVDHALRMTVEPKQKSAPTAPKV
jgi:cobaltochelatase CobT